MSFDFLPPQAYTKETLLKAYNWLQNQSDQVKELATTPDQLVSLYLKSTRLGQDSLQRYTSMTPNQTTTAQTEDRPSLQSFKSELKNLAGMMDGLEKPPVVQQQPIQQTQAAAPVTNTYVSAPAPRTNTALQYDEMTQNLIQEVKNELNLSSDVEALRMLVKIGYQKVRSLYK